MALKLFGFEIKRSDDDIEKQNISFAEPNNNDGALTVGTALGGSYGVLWDIEGAAKTEAELVTKYRQMSLTPEIQQAVDEIVNEAISVDSHQKTVEIILDDVKISSKVKEKIVEEFENILRLFDFSNQGYDIFQKFYVDGRLNYHIIIDETNLKRGIIELRYLDARKIRYIREMETKPITGQSGSAFIKKVKNEYYMYSESGFGTETGATSTSGFNGNLSGLKIAKDSIARVTSGLMNENNTVVLSYLHKAIKNLNQLRMLEDATVIYTITRAPDRRIFYVDVGNLPKAKAEQQLHEMMARHKNKVTYDSASGEIADGRKMLTMTEDFWFARREGSRGTEVTTLPGGTGLGEDRNLPYFQNKLYKSLNVPVSRLQPENTYSMGRSSEITREELKFSKFITKLRTKFSIIFDKCLEKQLVLKGIISPDEWKELRNTIRYNFMHDNYFEELKEAEILSEKLNTLSQVEQYIGQYFSREWVYKNVLFMSDEDIKNMKKEMDAERKEGLYDDPSVPMTTEPNTNAPDKPNTEQKDDSNVIDTPTQEPPTENIPKSDNVINQNLKEGLGNINNKLMFSKKYHKGV